MRMRLEELSHRPLRRDEQEFKAAFRKGDQFLWEKPMSYAEYEKYVEEGIVVQTSTSHYYKDRSKNGLGQTVEGHEDEIQTDVTLHARYGYPVFHNHEYIEMVYIAVGSCKNFFEDSVLSMVEGDVCIIAPNAFHAISCTNDESCIVNFIVSRKFVDRNLMNVLQGGQVTADFLQDILYHRSTTPYILFPTGLDPWLQELTRRILTESVRQLHAYKYSINLLASEFLLHITREYEMLAIVPNQQTSNKNELIVAILGYLSVNYNHVTLGDTAKLFGYSVAYLSRMIRENTGKTYHTIVAELQMEHAVKLIQEGKKSLAEIAQEIGCFDSSHFYKKFKSRFGISPGQYQEITRTQENNGMDYTG